jgi:hypothetical protein
VGPRRDVGSQHHCYKAAGGRDQADCEGRHFQWRCSFYSRQKGPRMVVASRRA